MNPKYLCPFTSDMVCKECDESSTASYSFLTYSFYCSRCLACDRWHEFVNSQPKGGVEDES